ncbi:MAG: glycosyltransferase family 2 protein [Pelolinea sp.]|nr:glycosyltransferase family 2 protein [Pelolinea sp.]
MKKCPLVTIVTPSYNQAAYLEETILSVLNQDYEHIQYIIMDGASSDGSVAIIKRYEGKISDWITKKDCGQTDAINKGFALAEGEIIAWLNSDDTLLPNAVSEAVQYLSKNPNVGLVYGDANYIDEKSNVIGKFPAAQTSLKKLKRGYVHVPQQASFFRKSLWDQVGPLDPNFFFAMDYDLWVRLASISRITYLPRLWANFRLHADAKTISADDRCWPEMLNVHFRDGGVWFSQIVFKHYLRKLAAPLIRYRRRKLFETDRKKD